MTMPHMMNCPHSDSGWCLACVQEQLESELDDLRNAMAGAMDETCGASEKHCTCVPLLRARIKELESKLPVTADGVHVGGGYVVWFIDPPYVLPWKVEGGAAAIGEWPGTIVAFPLWGDDKNSLHKWPDDIDGLLPTMCYANKAKAEAHLRGIRKAESS